MGRKPRWNEGSLTQGVIEVKLSHWKWFSEYVNQELLDYTTFIYRGQSDATWPLQPTLDRLVTSPTSTVRGQHLKCFRLSARGRRGPNPPRIDDDNGWWALGQHHGLATPLLDWTESPFVALYFAIEGMRSLQSRNCAVWAVSQEMIQENNARIEADVNAKPIDGRKPIIEVVRPMSDENARLVSQRGLFTRSPNNMDIEQWVRRFNAPSNTMELIKISVPRRDADDCLRYLNRMNINRSTLFPDLEGASLYCNMELKITNY